MNISSLNIYLPRFIYNIGEYKNISVFGKFLSNILLGHKTVKLKRTRFSCFYVFASLKHIECSVM